MPVRRLVRLALSCAVMGATFAARGGSSAAFDWRDIPERRALGHSIQGSKTAGMLPRRAVYWSDAASVGQGLDATPDVHYGPPGNRQTPGPGDLIDRVLAVVEGQVIMLSDVRAFLELRLIEPRDVTDATPAVLTALIERQLILEEVARYVVELPPPVEVDARLAELVARVGGPEAFEHLLPTVGFTVDDLRQVLRDDLRIKRYLARRFPSARPPTEDEVAAYFREHAVEFRSGGVPQSFDAARDAARRRLSEVLRQELIAAWVAGLTARANVLRVTP